MEIEFSNGTAKMRKAQALTSKLVEQQVSSYKYHDVYKAVKHASSGKNAFAESIQFPPVNIVFYSYVFLESKVPSPLELISSYYRYYESEFKLSPEEVEYSGRTINKIDIDARLLRTYPSLVRDIHFYLLLVESGLFDEVKYSTSVDLNGKDLIVKSGNKEIIVSLMVDTQRSRKYKQSKNEFRHSYESPELVLLLDLSSASAFGDFSLYGEKDVEQVEHFISSL